MPKIKTNLHYNRGITSKRATKGGVHLRGLAPGQDGSDETSQRWRAVDDTIRFDRLWNQTHDLPAMSVTTTPTDTT